MADDDDDDAENLAAFTAFLEKAGPAWLDKLRPAAAHLVPHAPQRVISQELDDIAGSEELVANG